MIWRRQLWSGQIFVVKADVRFWVFQILRQYSRLAENQSSQSKPVDDAALACSEADDLQHMPSLKKLYIQRTLQIREKKMSFASVFQLRVISYAENGNTDSEKKEYYTLNSLITTAIAMHWLLDTIIKPITLQSQSGLSYQQQPVQSWPPPDIWRWLFSIIMFKYFLINKTISCLERFQ